MLGRKKKKMNKKDVAPCFVGKDINELNMVRCPDCGNIHFRHAGNVLTHREFDYPSKRHEGEVDTNSHMVYVCIGCGKPWAKVLDDLFDASKEIDVKKYDKVNKALQDETKTDANC